MSTPQQLSSFNNLIIPRYTIKNISAGGYTVTSADNGVILNYIGSTAITINLAPAVTLGPGFSFQVWGSSTAAITVDANGAEYINGPFNNSNGDTTYVMNGGTCQFTTDGVRWRITAFSHVGTYNNSVVIGNGATGQNNYTIAIGQGASTSSSYAISIGYLASTTQGYAIALGPSAGATGQYSVAIGYTPFASGQYSVAVGWQATASGQYSVAIGGILDLNGPTATQVSSYAFGIGPYSTVQGKYAYASGERVINSAGATTYQRGLQYGLLVLRSTSNSATPVILTSDPTLSAVGSTNQIILQNNSAYAYTILVVGRQAAANGSNSAAWEFKGLVRREATAATTTIVNNITTTLTNLPGWTVALSADTTNGGLTITATGAASANVRWVATAQTAEVTYS